MGKKKRINFTMVLALLAVVALLMLPTQALSAKKVKDDTGLTNPDIPIPDAPPVPPDGPCDYTDPNFPPDGDNDGDGFTNQQECEGLVADGQVVNFNYPSCLQQSLIERKDCLHPESPDLFVILVPLESGSLIPENTDPLQYINLSKFDGDVLTGYLGVQTHLVGGNTGLNPFADRSVVVGYQKALRVTESNLLLGKFGVSGDTNIPLLGKDDAKVYTYQIKEFVNAQFADGEDHAQIREDFILHTIAHEIGHGINLYITCNDRYDGCHLRPGTGFMMEESIKVQGIDFFISDQFKDLSVEGFELAAPL